MNDPGLPVFVINLERSADRRARIAEAFAAIGVKVRFHAAVDGAASDLRTSPLYDRASRVAAYGGDLTSREIACYLSHLSVMRRCLEEGIERAIILEDDVRPEPGFVAAAQRLAAAPDCFELVRLYGLRPRAALDICQLTDSVKLVWPTHGLCGAQGYYLTAAAMRKILSAGKIAVPFDMMLDRYWRTDVSVFALSPYVISTQDAASDIGERRDLWADGTHKLLRARLKARKLAERVARSSANLGRRLRLASWRRRAAAAFAEAPVRS
jgi:glycosyl transferase family 25